VTTVIYIGKGSNVLADGVIQDPCGRLPRLATADFLLRDRGFVREWAPAAKSPNPYPYESHGRHAGGIDACARRCIGLDLLERVGRQVHARPADPFDTMVVAGGVDVVLPHAPPPPLWFKDVGSVRGVRMVAIIS
jgi:hypothetical protein